MSEPKGFCPFCQAGGWEICDHFVGYRRHDFVVIDKDGESRPGPKTARKLKACEVSVPTGVSIRVYSSPTKGKRCRANALKAGNAWTERTGDGNM